VLCCCRWLGGFVGVFVRATHYRFAINHIAHGSTPNTKWQYIDFKGMLRSIQIGRFLL
jgi:hypothetical protein